MSSSTVVHLDPDLHEAFKRHCMAHERQMKDSVEQLIREELASARLVAEQRSTESLEQRKLEMMRQRRERLTSRTLAPLAADSRDPWTRPPFWTAPGYKPPAPTHVKPKDEEPDEHTFTLN